MTQKQAAVAVALMAMSDLSKLIGRIGKASATLTNQIQLAAVQCIGYSIRDRNATPAMQLFDAVGTTQRRDALVRYFEMFGNLGWSKAEKRVIFIDVAEVTKGQTVLEWTEEYAAKVAQVMWHKTKAEPEPKSVFDIDEETAKFIERFTRAKKRGAELKNGGLLERLMATYHAYVAEQYRGTAIPTDEDLANAKDPVERAKLEALQQKFGGKPQKVAA